MMMQSGNADNVSNSNEAPTMPMGPELSGGEHKNSVGFNWNISSAEQEMKSKKVWKINNKVSKKVSYVGTNFHLKPTIMDFQSSRDAKKHSIPNVLKQLAMTSTLSQETHFSSSEVGRLLQMFSEHFNATKSVKSNHVQMDHALFVNTICNTFRILDEHCLEGIFRAFDSHEDNSISQQEWIRALSVFLRGTPMERACFSFKVYDLDGNGEISRGETFSFLKTSLVKIKEDDDTEEHVKDMVELIMRKLDHNRDGKVTLPEFLSVAREDPLMMECLGQVFPSESVIEDFECTFADKHMAFPYAH